MTRTSLSATLLVCALTFVAEPGSAQSVAGAAKVSLTEDEKLFSADPATYTSGEKYALQWSPIRENDILWKKRVHRNIDAAQEENRPLNKPDFSVLLLAAIQSGRVNAYADEQFVHKLPIEDAETKLAASALSKLKLKEDWLYLRDGRELVGRIIGIAPVMREVDAEGETSERPLLWIYYPELRPVLRDHAVANADESVKNLDQWFEGRRFASVEVETVSEVAPPRLQ